MGGTGDGTGGGPLAKKPRTNSTSSEQRIELSAGVGLAGTTFNGTFNLDAPDVDSVSLANELRLSAQLRVYPFAFFSREIDAPRRDGSKTVSPPAKRQGLELHLRGDRTAALTAVELENLDGQILGKQKTAAQSAAGGIGYELLYAQESMSTFLGATYFHNTIRSTVELSSSSTLRPRLRNITHKGVAVTFRQGGDFSSRMHFQIEAEVPFIQTIDTPAFDSSVAGVNANTQTRLRPGFGYSAKLGVGVHLTQSVDARAAYFIESYQGKLKHDTGKESTLGLTRWGVLAVLVWNPF